VSTNPEYFVIPEEGQPVLRELEPESWRQAFWEWRGRLNETLGGAATRIDHIGSTGLAGVPAKPILDLQVSVPAVDRELDYAPRLESLGFELRVREPEHRFFRRRGRVSTVHVHVCESGGNWERIHLLFRDYLVHHPDRAAAYGAMKTALAATPGMVRHAYTDAKGPFILETLQQAETWAKREGWKP